MPLAEDDKGGFFDKAPRKCQACGKLMDYPASLQLGDGTGKGVVKELCGCGGELKRL